MRTTLSMPSPQSERAVVPCKGCTACCHGERVVLITERGDNPALYKTEPATINDIGVEMYGIGKRMLAHKQNGDCYYLGDKGCTIWDRAPYMCKIFDCRRFYLRFTKAERRELDRMGMDQSVIRAGRKRLASLEGGMNNVNA